MLSIHSFHVDAISRTFATYIIMHKLHYKMFNPLQIYNFFKAINMSSSFVDNFE